MSEESLMDKYTLSMSKPQGNLECWGIGDPQKPKGTPYGFMWVEFGEDLSECFIWLIFVQRRHRRKGYARDMIGILKQKFKKVMTGYETGHMNEEGVKLCMACGLVPKPSIHKRKNNMLVWERK